MITNRRFWSAAAFAGFIALAPLPSFADDTPVPLPCDPSECGPVPIELPGCPSCEPGPVPDPAPGGPIE